ncbi:MAG: RsmE family RNA methyltransferase [Phycisphaerae bacterium]
MTQRLFVPSLAVGRVELPPGQAHHARAVLRLASGAVVELFDAAGRHAAGTLEFTADSAFVAVAEVLEARPAEPLVVVAAIPKGERADLLAAKLAEVGATAWWPLLADRSVVKPGGANKLERWRRLAVEAAKQCGRGDVMHIPEPLSLPDALARAANEQHVMYVCTTERPAAPLRAPPGPVAVFIGPEGGWTERELAACEQAGATPCRLLEPVLRVETAAVVAAALVAAGRIG